MKKQEHKSIDDFINKYEKSVVDLKGDGAVLPEELYAMQLIDAVNIPDKDIKIILTGIDYEKKEEMFKDAKKSLRKFLGKEFKKNEVPNERSEVFATTDEEVFYIRQYGGRKFDENKRGGWNM